MYADWGRGGGPWQVDKEVTRLDHAFQGELLTWTAWGERGREGPFV